MKITNTKFFKHQIYPLSFMLLVMAGILSSVPAYSQVDYTYGISKKGFRIDLGAGVTTLHSNWSSNPLGEAGLLGLDYDLNQYFSIGLQGNFGTMEGKDVTGKFYYYKTTVVFGSGSLGFKVALGQFTDFHSKNGFQDAIKRLYVGAGIGEVYSNVTMVTHNSIFDGKGLATLAQSGPVGKDMPFTKSTSKGDTGNASFIQIPINFGTNIALRGFLGNDKVELNPNFQYVFVQSPYFDGYQPNSSQASGYTVNGNQAYFVGSLTLRYKF